MRLEINYKKKNFKKHKHVEAKQYATKQPMDHWEREELTKLQRKEDFWTHFMGPSST